MSTPANSIYSLLPAIFRLRDAQQGGQLEALFKVLEDQAALVRENVWQLYDDQFIETCAPWAIPYIGQLIGFEPIYTVALSGPDSRAEVANTIGYRRRKGTLLAMEQLTHDVSARTTIAVEEFKRLITTLSLRDVRPHRAYNANLRRGRDWEDPAGPFNQINRSIDVRRIAPRNRIAPTGPDQAPLEMALHGPGRFNIPDVAVWMWRWRSWQVTSAPAFTLGSGGYFFSSLGGPVPLFQKPLPTPLPFSRLTSEADAPKPISRYRFKISTADFYPVSIQLIEDGMPVDVSRIVCANLTETSGAVCHVPSGKIAIDPELGRIQYAEDVPLPTELRVSYSYGASAPIGGGPYDRSADLIPAKSVALFAVVGTANYPTLESAIAAWNTLPAGSAGIIVLPNFESYVIDLTASHAVQIPNQSQLLIAAGEVSEEGAPPEWNKSRVTLRGDIEVIGQSSSTSGDGQALPIGQIQFSGIWLAGEIRLVGDAVCAQITDCTLTPGRSLTRQGEAAFPGEPSLSGSAIAASVCMSRSITGPIALPASCSVRIIQSIVDSGSPYCPAFAGADLSSPGAVLHIEDSTVVGRVWTKLMRLASNTIFHAWMGRRDPWQSAVWSSQRQTGCVRFCWLPWNSLVPRRYECLPQDSASEAAMAPQFISLHFGQPGYCMLSGDVPLAIWKGADNSSQMGVYQSVQETEAVTNIQIRSAEYLPANMELGVFLIPSRPELQEALVMEPYGYGPVRRRCREHVDVLQETPFGIGIGLL
jgi:hypothetical protein